MSLFSQDEEMTTSDLPSLSRPTWFPQWLSSVRAVMILLISLATIFPLGVILYQGLQHRAQAYRDSRTLSERIATQVVFDQQLLLSSAEQLMSTFPYIPAIRRRDAVTVNALLADLIRKNPQFTNLLVADEKGNVWVSALPVKALFNVADRRFFRNAMATGRFSSGEFIVARGQGNPVLSFGYPLKDGSGRITDMAIVSFSLDKYDHYFHSKGLGTEASLALFDHKGTILFARPTLALIGKQDREDLFRKMTAGPDEGSFDAVGLTGVHRILACRKLRLPGETLPYMYVRAGISVSSILGRTQKDFLLWMGSMGVAAILILLASVLLGKRFVLDKVAALREATERISRGDLSTRVPDIVSGGELGELGNAFDNMARRLQEADAERQKAEETLRQSEKKNRESEILLRMVADGTPDAVYVKDLRGRYLLFNAAASRFTGKSAAEAIGNDDTVLFPAEEARTVMEGDRGVIAFGKAMTYEEHVTTAEGERATFLSTKGPMIDERGNVTGLFGIARDITEQKRAEEEKLNLERQVRQTQKLESLGVLAGGIAHDFNNILMAVLGHAELALEEISPMSAARGNLTEITTAARRAADLCRQMLAYAGKASFALERVELRELVEEMAHLLKTAISKKAILNLNLERGLPPIQADPSQIRQIVMNLIINASEAIGDRSGVITVSVGATRCDEEYLRKTELREALTPGLYVHLEVTDTGGGMNAETRSRIFEPFFSTKFTGRGLGLAAVLGIVRAHRGALKVYSEPGKGTTFKVLFPALEDAGTEARTNDSSARADWRGKGTILLVDDEESLIALGSRMLEHLGFTVLTAADGLQAVDLYRERGKEIDFVLMDLTMPHMDGAEAFGELRRLNPEVRVVLASGYSREDVTSRFAGKQLNGVLQKPYTLAKLREVFAGLMPKRPDGDG